MRAIKAFISVVLVWLVISWWIAIWWWVLWRVKV